MMQGLNGTAVQHENINECCLGPLLRNKPDDMSRIKKLAQHNKLISQ